MGGSPAPFICYVYFCQQLEIVFTKALAYIISNYSQHNITTSKIPRCVASRPPGAAPAFLEIAILEIPKIFFGIQSQEADTTRGKLVLNAHLVQCLNDQGKNFCLGETV